MSASADKKRKDAQAELELIKKGLLNASDERKQELEDLITALNALNDYKNQVLIIACHNIKSTECSVARAELDKAYQSKLKVTPHLESI